MAIGLKKGAKHTLDMAKQPAEKEKANKGQRVVPAHATSSKRQSVFKRLAVPMALSVGLAIGGSNLAMSQAPVPREKVVYVQSADTKKAAENFLNPNVKISKRDAQLIVNDMFARLKQMFPEQYATYVAAKKSRGLAEQPTIILVNRLSDTYPEKTGPSSEDATCTMDTESRPHHLFVPRAMKSQDEANGRLASLAEEISSYFLNPLGSSLDGGILNFVHVKLLESYFADGIRLQPEGNEFLGGLSNTSGLLVLPADSGTLNKPSPAIPALAIYLRGNGEINEESILAYFRSEIARDGQNKKALENILGSDFYKKEYATSDEECAAAIKRLEKIDKAKFNYQDFKKKMKKANDRLVLYLLDWGYY